MALERALERDPEKRLQSADELAASLLGPALATERMGSCRESFRHLRFLPPNVGQAASELRVPTTGILGGRESGKSHSLREIGWKEQEIGREVIWVNCAGSEPFSDVQELMRPFS